MIQSTGTDYACFDGNGNLGQLVEAGSGSVVAHYEYDPFGNTITGMGNRWESNPYRFSTKYYDDTTGLVYYGYRYYSPEMGRWINRDPLLDYGGLNYYQFIGNNSISFYDNLGLIKCSQAKKCSVKSLKITSVKWIIDFPERKYLFFKDDRYTIRVDVKLRFELDEDSSKEDCVILQKKTGRVEYLGNEVPENYKYKTGLLERPRDERDGPLWWDGKEMHAANVRWNFNGKVATFMDRPGFNRISLSKFPIYWGGHHREGYFMLETKVLDKNTETTVKSIKWYMLIDYKSPENGIHDFKQ